MKNTLIKLSFFSVTFLFLFLVATNVKANSLDAINIKENFTRTVVVAADNETCPGFGDPEIKDYPAYWMQWTLNVMKYIAVVALLVFVISDFMHALVLGDKDALKKAGSTAIKRFIYCVLLFFVPIFVKIIMEFFGAYGTCGIG